MTRSLADVARILAEAGRPVVLVDGGAGAGKSTLVQRLVQAWPAREPRVVPLDDLYPGWTGLAAGSDAVHRTVLRADNPGYRRWNWATARPGDWVRIDPAEPLIIEGCGALTATNRSRATAGIWVSGSPRARRERALKRDGDLFAPHWDMWAAQERAHWCRNRPRDLADWIAVGGQLRPRTGSRR